MQIRDQQATAPIDILSLASERRHFAWECWYGTQHMNQSSLASVAAEQAMSNLMIADSDLQRAHSLILELARPIREIVDV